MPAFRRLLPGLVFVLLSCGVAAAQQQDAQQTQRNADTSRGSVRAEPGSPTIVVRFSASIPAQDRVSGVIDMAREPHVASIRVPAAEDENVQGVLVFRELEEYRSWRGNGRMNDFFGKLEAVRTSFEIFRSDLMRAGRPLSGDGLGPVHVEYDNTDNRSAGDADIDAVTVICPGDHADCKPSN